MNTKHLLASCAAFLAAVSLSYAGDTTIHRAAPTTAAASASTDARDILNKEIDDATVYYSMLQWHTATAVNESVLSQAKGVLILSRWSVSAGVGGTGGTGIGFVRNADGKFGAPAFYRIGGASLGLQVGASNVYMVALLMSDKALEMLTDNQYVWTGNLRAVAGVHSTVKSSIDNQPDIVLYQKATGMDLGVNVATTLISVDEDGNHVFYNNNNLTPTYIFAGRTIPVPDNAKFLLAALNQEMPKPGEHLQVPQRLIDEAERSLAADAVESPRD